MINVKQKNNEIEIRTPKLNIYVIVELFLSLFLKQEILWEIVQYLYIDTVEI